MDQPLQMCLKVIQNIIIFENMYSWCCKGFQVECFQKKRKKRLDENWKIATIERLYFFILGKF